MHPERSLAFRFAAPLGDELINDIVGAVGAVMLPDTLPQHRGGLQPLRLVRGMHQDMAHFRLHAVPGPRGTLAQAVAYLIGQITNGQYSHRALLCEFLRKEYSIDSIAVNYLCLALHS